MFADPIRADPHAASVPATEAPQRASRSAVPVAAQQMLALQTAGGNQAVLRMMARSHTAYAEEELPGPVSQGEPGPTYGPAVDSAPAVDPVSATGGGPAAACTITTRTRAAAPDGTANTRTRVGANEEVELTSSVPVIWTASTGTVVPAVLGPLPSATAVWTAPMTAGPGTITATPPGGTACTIAMTTVTPASRTLTVTSARSYTAGLSGSGFIANVVINPLDVSWTRIEVREEAVDAAATGYYDTVLHWNGLMHPVGTWLRLNAANGGLRDTVGTNPPGGPTPFSAGRFTWPIPQSFREPGTGGGARYSTGTHLQVMADATGAETTSKEGASGSRTP
ncbi:hypothetical protein AB0M20_12140 [Actinoplanes sp. NPDC051633]|uniref:hypothetical protein n=1 Tax=Actinoplanes sp. NPDC051633 TaxID=3155670 RepID=UPI00341BBC5A